MLKDKIDNTYLINLPSRIDRLAMAADQCRRVNIPFQVVPALDGSRLNVELKSYNLFDELYWNKGAYGLCLTTIGIIKDAMDKGYENIMILEDDVLFNPMINEVVDRYWDTIPSDYQMIMIGAHHCINPEFLNRCIVRCKFSVNLHAYVVNKSVYEYYLRLLEQKNKPIDLMTSEDIQPLNKTYGFYLNSDFQGLAYQRKSFSNIQDRLVGGKY